MHASPLIFWLLLLDVTGVSNNSHKFVILSLYIYIYNFDVHCDSQSALNLPEDCEIINGLVDFFVCFVL